MNKEHNLVKEPAAAEHWVPIWRDYVKTVEAERDSLAAQNRELREALEKAAATFHDIGNAMKTLGRPRTTQACEIAEAHARALLTRSPGGHDEN